MSQELYHQLCGYAARYTPRNTISIVKYQEIIAIRAILVLSQISLQLRVLTLWFINL